MAKDAQQSRSEWGSPNQAKLLVILLVVLGLVIAYAIWLNSYTPFS